MGCLSFPESWKRLLLPVLLRLIEGQGVALMPQGGPLSLQVPLHTPQPSCMTEIGSYPSQPPRSGTGLAATFQSRAVSLPWGAERDMTLSPSSEPQDREVWHWEGGKWRAVLMIAPAVLTTFGLQVSLLHFRQISPPLFFWRGFWPSFLVRGGDSGRTGNC